MNRKLELFERPEILSKVRAETSKISNALDNIEGLLGPDAMPLFWAAHRDGHAQDAIGEIWDVIKERRSQDELQMWVDLGGRVEFFFAPGSPVVVRLVSFREGHSCFGVAYSTDCGRRFSLIENELVRSGRLREFFSCRGAWLCGNAESDLECEFRGAISQLVLPTDSDRG